MKFAILALTLLVAVSAETTDITPTDFVSDIFTGLMKGLSQDGKSLGDCYDRIMDGMDDIEFIAQILGDVFQGNANFGSYSLLFTKFYGHFNAAKNDCRVHVLVTHMADINAINEKVSEYQPQLTTLATTIGMQFMMKNYEGAARQLGSLIADFFDFYVN